MTQNTVGYVCPYDGGVPRTVTGIATDAISGGHACYASGAVDNISSGLNSYVTSDIDILPNASGLLFNGIAIDNVASGTEVAIATRGIVIATAGGTCTAGRSAMIVGDGDGFINLAATSGSDVPVMTTATAGAKVGRFWSSTATSGNFVLVELTP